MVLTGHVQDGKVVLASPLPLPDGTEVRLVVVTTKPPADPSADPPKSFHEHYKDVIGTVDLPADAATQHDHYLYGTPKR